MKTNSTVSVIVGVAIVPALGLGVTYFYDKQPSCTKSHDECLQDQIEKERDVTLSKDAAFEKQIKDIQDLKIKFDTDQAAKINGYKADQTQGWGADQKSKGQLQNVYPEMLKQSPLTMAIPTAEADTTIDSEISLNTEKAVSINPDRYTAVLASYHSPYQGVPIEKYCNDAGLVQWRCDIMVGIAQQESQMGKDYHCVQQTDKHAVELGQTYYFNPMGLKYPGEKGRSMDFNGCFVRKFESWDDFWQFMPRSFMDPSMAYYIGYWSTVKELSGIWKNGNINNTDKEWYGTVSGVVNKI